jgi:hypothetical protein
MTKDTLLGIAMTPFGVVTITQPDPGGVMRDLPDLSTPAVQSRPQFVVARWRRTEEGRLEACWLPTTPEAV